MHKITVKGTEKILWADDGALLSKVLTEGRADVEHPCGGRGVCGKCTVIVNGKKELSCTYEIKGDIEIEIPKHDAICTATSGDETGRVTENMCLCLDIGTTTLALALVSMDEGEVVRSKTHNNPQRAFASDVMSRIDYASKNGVEAMQRVLLDKVDAMADELCIDGVDTLFVAGNTTMLHIFFGIDPSPMGYAPYTPAFLEGKEITSDELGIKCARKVVSMPGISAFVGADIVAGLNFVNMPDRGKYNILVDLGTNAEIVLYSPYKLYCTAAAAGPCFEGVNISCGMSATEGAVYSCTENSVMTIGGGEAKGICATGLVDSMALMLDGEYMDETGFLELDFEVTENVSITREDVRQFQLAKSAICSGIYALVKKAGIGFDDIEKVYVAGGFSSKMNVGNALRTGLLPKETGGKIYTVDNSCLKGLVKYACEKNKLNVFLDKAEYVDLAMDGYFQDLFIENMIF